MQNACLITIDVEEWFQVENLRSAFPKNTWKNQKSTVAKNTTKILNILNDYNIKGTFFILGLVAQSNPELVKLISEHGHEIASHGTGHDLTYNLDENQLFDDISKSKEQIEKLIGKSIYGYRAPNFSVNDRLIKTLKKLNFHYDSSYNPFQLNQRYGKLDIDNSSENNSVYNLNNNFYEIPLSSLKMEIRIYQWLVALTFESFRLQYLKIW
jgi:polysaccharide deacetylase family protein (PEP-CTERM system associated)